MYPSIHTFSCSAVIRVSLMNRDDIDYLQNTNWFATSGAGLSSRGRRMIKVEFYQVQR